ncbi:SRPBCC family protein [Parafrigoribacterium mesophilum]
MPCVPGATLTSQDGESFTGSVKVKLGPISMTYNGTGTFVERDKAAGRIVVEAKGKDKRGNGTAGATVQAQITAVGDSTAVEVNTDLAVTGKPAQFGRGVIQEVSDKLLGQFVDAFIAKLSPDAAGVGSAEGGPEGGSGVGAARGADIAGGNTSAASTPATASTPAASTPATISTQASASIPLPAPWLRLKPAPGSEPAELDLLSTVLPVLVRRYAVPAGIALVVMLAIRRWLKR